MVPPLQMVEFTTAGVRSVIEFMLNKAASEVIVPQSSVISTRYSVPLTFCLFTPILSMLSKALFAPLISEKFPPGGFCCHW